MSKSRGRLSTNFAISEFDCRDGSVVPPIAHSALRRWCAEWGEPLRRAFGPVRVTSGFRTPTYNRRVGGATASLHVYDLGVPRGVLPDVRGVAADVVPARGTPAEWERWALRHLATEGWKLGRGRGAAVAYRSQGFIHLDTGARRSWAA